MVVRPFEGDDEVGSAVEVLDLDLSGSCGLVEDLAYEVRHRCLRERDVLWVADDEIAFAFQQGEVVGCDVVGNEVFQEPAQSPHGVRFACEHLAEFCRCLPDGFLEHCEQEVVLAAEVLVEGARRVAGACAQLVEGEVFSGLVQELDRGGDVGLGAVEGTPGCCVE